MRTAAFIAVTATLAASVHAGPVNNTVTAPTKVDSSAPTTIAGGRVINTPTPAQPGMVSNCDHFYKLAKGDSCASIIAKYGLTIDDFTTWNSQVGGPSCNNLWLNNHVCVSTLGHQLKQPVVTPSPVQTGMVKDCKRFHLVKAGDSCDAIAAKYKEKVENVIRWNPAVGEKCYNLWVGFHACVGI